MCILTTTSVKVDNVIDQLKNLNEMELTQVMAHLKYQIETSHHPKLIRSLQDTNRIEELENELMNLESDYKSMEQERDEAVKLHGQLIKGIKDLILI